VRDTLLLTGRSLRAIPRVPERLLDVTIQPIVFILLFLYVFGSAIHVPGSATRTTCSRGSSASRSRSA
jgi:ABC-2 type transport system permease protein